MGLALVAFFLISWGYGAFCEGVWSGQTPGKRALNLRVISERGLPITGDQAVLRNLVGAVDGMIPFCYLIWPLEHAPDPQISARWAIWPRARW